MIAEFIQHLFHPAPKHIKGLGLLREAIAIEARYRRCKEAWQPHIENCHALIRDYAPPEKITLLGAGLLHDVPIDLLLEKTKQIELVDIIFLEAAEHYARAHPIVRLIEDDVTSGLKYLWEKGQITSSNDIFETPIPNFLKYQSSDLVVSLNILSQLALPFERHLKTKKPGIADMIMLHHVNALKLLGKPVLMIADITHHYHHRDGTISHDHVLPSGFNDKPLKIWAWDIAPKGEYDRHISITHTVGAWAFNMNDVNNVASSA